MNKFKIAAISALLVTGLAGQASAHAAWISERHGDLAVVYGDLSDEGYDISYIESIAAKKADMSDCMVTRKDHDDHVEFSIGAEGVYVSTAYMRGYSTKDKDGNRFNKPKNEVENAASSGYYVKYATAILGKIGGEPQAQGVKLEILPLTDPTRIEMGGKLTVQVLFEGKPLAGAKFYPSYTTDNVHSTYTDEDGKVTFLVKNQGENVLAVKHSVLTPEAATQDKFGYYSTLSFKSLNAKREKRAAEKAAKAAAEKAKSN